MTENIEITTLVVAILAGAVRRGTPMALAALGETLAEKSGIINLGVEGMMLVGAMVAVAVQVATGNPLLAAVAAGCAAGCIAAIHAVLVIRLNVNQIVSGFALTVLGTGVSGFLGREYIGVKIQSVPVWDIPCLSNIPVIGDIFFRHDPFVYGSVILAAVLWLLMFRTRFGLNVRAVGEDPKSAYAQGISVGSTRALAVIIGGFLAGVGGAQLSLAYVGLWSEQMTAGQGWIAIGLVVVAGWHPMRCLLVSWLFGALLVLHPHLQAAGIPVSPYLVAMLPYVLAIVALTLATLALQRRGYGLPAALSKQFRIER